MIRESIRQRRIKLELDELLLYYSVPILLFIVGLVPIVILIIDVVSKPNESVYHWFIPISLFWGFSLVYAIISYRNLRLVPYEPTLPMSEVRVILIEIALRRKWEIPIQNDYIFMAYSKGDSFFSLAGEYITVLFDGNTVYVNSRSKPVPFKVPVSSGKNKINRDIVIYTIEAFEAKAAKTEPIE